MITVFRHLAVSRSGEAKRVSWDMLLKGTEKLDPAPCSVWSWHVGRADLRSFWVTRVGCACSLEGTDECTLSLAVGLLDSPSRPAAMLQGTVWGSVQKPPLTPLVSSDWRVTGCSITLEKAIHFTTVSHWCGELCFQGVSWPWS